MKALITGVGGQDGYYLARLLLDEGLSVWGMLRAGGQAAARARMLERELPGLNICYGDMLDANSLQSVIDDIRPDFIFNLAAISYVPSSWQQPALVLEVNALGTIRLLEAARASAPWAHIIQASSSEMYGGGDGLTESSPMLPRSIYGASKLLAHNTCGIYRMSYGMHVSSMIAFNHESERRPEHFVTAKIAHWAARRKLGLDKTPIRLGAISSVRDWGYAPDYMRAYWLAACSPNPDDYVVATGEGHTVFEFLAETCAYMGIEMDYIVDSSLTRPWEVSELRGDASKIKAELGWVPKTRFKELVQLMCDSALSRVQNANEALPTKST